MGAGVRLGTRCEFIPLLSMRCLSQDLFSSTSTTIRVRCGHIIHSKCYAQLLRSTYKCPLCFKSLADMSSAYAALDHEIALTPMPLEYATVRKQVLCNDCHEVRDPSAQGCDGCDD